MSEWEPEVDFESEMLSIHPECDITPENYCNPPKSLAGKYLKSLGAIDSADIQNGQIPNLPDLGAQMRMADHVTRNRPVGRRVVPANDSDNENDSYSRANETVMMLRRAGMGPHVEGIDSRRSIATVEIKDDYTVCKNTVSRESGDKGGTNITHTILNSSTTSTSSEDEKHPTHFNSHAIHFFAPRELYEMKRAKPHSKIFNTKKLKKKLQPPQ